MASGGSTVSGSTPPAQGRRVSDVDERPPSNESSGFAVLSPRSDDAEDHSVSRRLTPPALLPETGLVIPSPYSQQLDTLPSRGVYPPLPDPLEPTTVLQPCALTLGGAPVPLEVVWSAELPSTAPDFNVDVTLSNGLSIVVPHAPSADRQWFTVARDGGSRRSLIVRFEPDRPPSSLRLLLTLIGSPFASEASTLAVLVLATLLSLGGLPATSATRDGSSIVPSAVTRKLASLELLDFLVDPRRLRLLLLGALGCAFLCRLSLKLLHHFPPSRNYTLIIKPGYDADYTPLRGRKRLASGDRSSNDPQHSIVHDITTAFQAAIIKPVVPSGSPSEGANGASGASGGGGTAGVELLVAPLLEAIEKEIKYGGGVFGPMMILAIRNDEGNLRKARQVCAKLGEGSAESVVTLRCLLEAERATGIHRPGAVLADPSAAIAFLWMRRTLQFLCHCMQGVMETDDPKESVGTVARGAYTISLEPFHGWLLKNTFGVAMGGMPRKDEFINRLMDAPQLSEEERTRICERELGECVETTRVVIDAMRALFEELELEDLRKV